MAYEHFARRDYKEARPFADKALKLKPHHPLASYVKARLLVTIGDDDAALEVLEPALDPDKPNERVIDLLAELQMKAGNLDEAERLYELARKDDPVHTKWIAGLARVHLRQKDNAKFLADLAMIADNDADDLDVRKALAERHLAAGAARRGREVGDRVPLHRRLRPRQPRPPGRRPGRPEEVRPGRRGVPDRPRAEGQEAQRPQGQASPRPSSASASATRPRRPSTPCSRTTPTTPRPRPCATRWPRGRAAGRAVDSSSGPRASALRGAEGMNRDTGFV